MINVSKEISRGFLYKRYVDMGDRGSGRASDLGGE